MSFSSLVSCGLVGSKARGRIVRFAIDICIIVHINEYTSKSSRSLVVLLSDGWKELEVRFEMAGSGLGAVVGSLAWLLSA